ncbi:MAG TPA: preprotein translocase subunit SecE, partial [Phycisphaerales bacterium]|nr:preprotein translocase subunit SecE [Phycisphaerales bacterium]
VPAGIAAAAAAFLAWLSNWPSMADFFIAAEGEIKKVRWSTRKEIMASTTIVVIVVFVFSVLLFAADFFFAWLFMDTLKIY